MGKMRLYPWSPKQKEEELNGVQCLGRCSLILVDAWTVGGQWEKLLCCQDKCVVEGECCKNYEGDVKELSLDFTIAEETLGKRHVIELKPGGKDICVTNENKLQYIHAIAGYKLNRQILPFSNAFYRGLTDLISPSWLKLFNASEFNQLLSGGNHDIDVDDLRKNTQYTGGYSEGSRTIKIFWEVFAGLEPRERCMLLKFVTSCSRAPLLGFKHLQPAFTIHKVVCDVPIWATIGGQDVDRLPSASTCYNTLKLPTYKRAGTLRAKLLYAINSNTGFELS